MSMVTLLCYVTGTKFAAGEVVITVVTGALERTINITLYNYVNIMLNIPIILCVKKNYDNINPFYIPQTDKDVGI